MHRGSSPSRRGVGGVMQEITGESTRSGPIPERRAAGLPFPPLSDGCGQCGAKFEQAMSRAEVSSHCCGPLGERTTSCRGTVQFPAVKGQRLLRRQAPVLAETRLPGKRRQKRQNEAYQAVLSPFTSSGRLGIYQPLMTSSQKAVLEQPLPVGPRHVACANRRGAVSVLEPVQDFEGFRQFFRRGSHVCQKLVLCVARKLVYYVVS